MVEREEAGLLRSDKERIFQISLDQVGKFIF